MRKHLLFILLAETLLVGCNKAVEQMSTPTSAVRPEAIEPCDEKVNTAKRTGYYDGIAKGRQNEKEAEAKDLESQDGKIPIEIIVEDIPGQDSYMLAAADTITTYFSSHYSISHNARLVLSVSGTRPIDGVSGYDVKLETDFFVNIPTGEKMNPVFGWFVLSDKGGALKMSSPEAREHAIKAAIYGVLSEGDAKLFPHP